MIKINLNFESKDKHEMVLELEHIAELIDGGYTSGYEPTWSLEGEEEKVQPSRQELIEAQDIYCTENKVPMFAPSDGKCWYCHQDCVTPKWAVEHITGCSKCNHTFCD